jgi:hypothetical protein
MSRIDSKMEGKGSGSDTITGTRLMSLTIPSHQLQEPLIILRIKLC